MLRETASLAMLASLCAACSAGADITPQSDSVGGAGSSGLGGGAGQSGSTGLGASVSFAGSDGAGGSSTGAGGSGVGGAPTAPPDISHTFPSITVQPGQEITGMCQSFTIGNDAPLDVNTVVATNEGKFHHSNWIWVADTMYTGGDGTWTCSDRGFDQVAAGAFGGVFFAQSTQSLKDTQAFPDGVAFQVPAHAQIIGDVHLINAASTPFTTSFHFDVYTIPESAVRVQLQPMAFTNLALDIAPLAETRARMQCATPQTDFDVYYVLPHFHVLGQWLDISVAGGAMDGTSFFRSQGGYGDSLGKTFDPPVSIHGASGLAITCDYQNPGSATVKYGNGNQEMCVALIYSTGKKAGGEAVANLTTTDSGGVHTTDAACVSVGSP